MDLKQALGPLTGFAEGTQQTVETGVERQLLQAGFPPEKAKSEGQRIAARLPSGPGLIGMLIASLIPGKGLIGSGARILGGATGAGVAARATGQPGLDAAQDFALQQAPAEVLFGAARAGRGQVRGRRLLKEHTAQVADREAQIIADKQTHAQAVAAQREQHMTTQTQQIGDLLKSQVAPFRGVPSTPEGLWRMAYGPEWFAVNKAYDASLKAVVAAGQGKRVPMSAKLAEELGVPIVEWEKRGPLTVGEIREPRGKVDAGMLAGAMTGQSLKHRAAYRAGAQALDEANLGDPQTRAMYRNAMAFRMFMDRSQALEGQQFHPDRVLKALGKLKANQELMRRGNVELFTKLEASKPPPELLPPPAPPEIPPSGVTKHEFPALAIPGLIAGAAVGSATHIPHLTWTGAIAGEELARRLGPKAPFFSGVPQPPVGRKQALGRTLTGEGIREVWQYINEPGP